MVLSSVSLSEDPPSILDARLDEDHEDLDEKDTAGPGSGHVVAAAAGGDGGCTVSQMQARDESSGEETSGESEGDGETRLADFADGSPRAPASLSLFSSQRLRDSPLTRRRVMVWPCGAKAEGARGAVRSDGSIVIVICICIDEGCSRKALTSSKRSLSDATGDAGGGGGGGGGGAVLRPISSFRDRRITWRD